MFIVNLTYIKPLDKVEKFLEKHIDFLNQYYTKGHFIASGRKNPRTGGIILMPFKKSLHTIHSIKMRLPSMISLNLR